MACGAVDVKTRGSGGWRDAAGVPPDPRPHIGQRTEGMQGQEEDGGGGRGRRKVGEVNEGQYRWRGDSPGFTGPHLFLMFILLHFLFF